MFFLIHFRIKNLQNVSLHVISINLCTQKKVRRKSPLKLQKKLPRIFSFVTTQRFVTRLSKIWFYSWKIILAAFVPFPIHKHTHLSFSNNTDEYFIYLPYLVEQKKYCVLMTFWNPLFFYWFIYCFWCWYCFCLYADKIIYFYYLDKKKKTKAFRQKKNTHRYFIII